MSRPEYDVEKLDPRLRMICNGDAEVNTLRSEMSGSVCSQVNMARKYRPLERLQQAAPDFSAVAEAVPERTELDQAPREVRVGCFIQLDGTGRSSDIPGRARRRGDLLTADLTPRQARKLAGEAFQRGIQYIETGHPLSHPNPSPSRRRVEEPEPRAPEGAPRPDTPRVLLGLIDVGGFDFSHPDFLDADDTTRFLRIWDQGARSGSPPSSFGYGSELTRDAMNAALDGAAGFGVAATDLLPQTVQVPGAHATHVASIAAGNRGVCPHAEIAGVLLALSPEELERHRTLYDSTRLAHAVDYLFDLGDELGLPTVINVSLGTNGHAHDGSSPVNRWIDAALDRPGRVVCVAAGNSGQEAPQFEGDLGFLSGRIHASGVLPSKGLVADLEWQVVGNGRADVSENELEIWYPASDVLEVQVRTPSGAWFDPVRAGEYFENEPLDSGTFLSIYNERYHPSNGDNRISIFLSPRLKEPVVGVEAGTWTVRLRGVEIRDGRFDAWIERDDPRPLGRVGDVQAWRFPSFFSHTSNVDRSSVSSLACGRLVISVANGDDVQERIHPSSSQGPTRDGRFKPEIVAPGTDVVAARGFGPPDKPWIAKTGTSMASPYVAGVAAQMLALEKRLTATQIVGMMRRTAQPLPGSDYLWRDDAGFGRLQPEACLEEVDKPFTSRDVGKERRES